MRAPRQPLRFSVSALAIVLRAYRIGEAHITLADTPAWYPPEERAEIDHRAFAEFAEQGLTGSGGRLLDSTLEWLPALSMSPVEYYCWVAAAGETAAYLVAGGVLAARFGERVDVVGIDRDNSAATLIKQLPPAATPRASSLNVRRSDLAGGGRSPDARRFHRMARQPETGLGELYVAVRDQLGKRHSIPQPIRYRDTACERWMIATAGDYLSVIPATPTLFTTTLHKVKQQLC